MPTAAHFARLGWPDPRRGEAHARTHLAVAGAGVGLKLPVFREIVPLVDQLCLGLASRGVQLRTKADDWGFAWRLIRGGETWSYHIGLAVDLDAIDNPLGVRRTTFPIDETRNLARGLGFRWGYDYANRPDAMHFEFMGSRADAVALCRNLRRNVDWSALDQRRDDANRAEALNPRGDDVTPDQIDACATLTAEKVLQQLTGRPKDQRGVAIGAELDMVRRDLRKIGAALGVEVES